jgi:uncharacterized protein (TIGR03435 family)
MGAPILQQLKTGKKFLLATIAVAAVGGPFAIGLTYRLRAIAQAVPQTASPLQFEVASVDPKATEDQVRLMLQSLLLDRFKMKFHRDTKDAQGYALSVAKGGPRMQEAQEGHVPGMPDWMSRPPTDSTIIEELVVALMPSKGVGSIIGRRANMLQLTETLQRLLSTAVFDQTGLSARYYFGFRYATDEDPEIPYPDLFAAIKEIGLRLEKHKGPMEMLVVDHMETVPTGN